MMRSTRTVIASLTIAAGLCLPAVADPTPKASATWDTLQRFGWTGRWAYSCKDPPGLNNLSITVFLDTDGKAKRKLDRGASQTPLLSVIDSAQILTETTLEMRLRNDDSNWGRMNGMVFDVVQTLENDRIRVMSSKDAEGSDYIKNGVNLTAGQPTPWTYRCKD